MNTKIEWTARVRARENVVSLEEFAADCKKGLSLADFVPESVWIESASFDFQRRAEVVLRWDTEMVMELTENYVPSSTDRSAASD